jgi:aspartate aminotransferase-like enzyme
MSGTGSFGIETCVLNLVEPGDRVLVGVNGVFGQRLAEMARRCRGGRSRVALGALADGLSERGFRPAQAPAFRAQF